MSGPTSGWKLAFEKVAQRNPALIEEVAVEWEIQGKAVRSRADEQSALWQERQRASR